MSGIAGIDAHITGGRYSNDGMVPHVCPSCNHIWHAAMFSEYGGCFYKNDDDSVCPKCSTPGLRDVDAQGCLDTLRGYAKKVEALHAKYGKMTAKELKDKIHSVAVSKKPDEWMDEIRVSQWLTEMRVMESDTAENEMMAACRED